MTTVASRPENLWATMPGWGISANLLPPEIIAARRVRVVRKAVVAAIIAVVLLGAGGYTYAYLQNRNASDGLATQQNRTTELQSQQRKYDEVVRISGDVTQIKSVLAGLLRQDVDLKGLTDEVFNRLPKGGAITQLTATIQAGAQAAPLAGAVLLTPSGHLPIGTMNITGTCGSMGEVATLVSQLSSVPGIVAVYPTSQQSSGKTVQYTLQMALTDQVYSHRFDVGPTTASTSASPTGG